MSQFEQIRELYPLTFGKTRNLFGSWLGHPSFPWYVFGALLMLVLGLSLTTRFDRDEVEALHTSWKILQGERIYTDFFQHHHPFFYYLLVPLVAVLGEHTRTLVAARLVSFCLLLLMLLVTYLLARRIFSPPTAPTSLVLVLSTLMFSYKVVEVRPDIPQVLFSLLALLLIFVYLDCRQKRYLILSAVSLAIAILFLQKAVSFGFLIFGLLLYYGFKRKIRFYDLPLYVMVVGVCLLPYVGYLVLTGSFPTYLLLNWSLNVNFLLRDCAYCALLYSYQQSSLVWFFYALGLLFTLKYPSQRSLALVSLGLIALAIVTRKAHHQYFIIVFPLIAMIAAQALHMLLRRKRIIHAALVLVFVLSSSHYLKSYAESTRSQQLQKIDYVLSMTSDQDYVYDGRNSFNLFRKDLDYFWFSLNPGAGLDTYQTFQPYEYNIYRLIRQYQPKVISTYLIPNLHNHAIANSYRRSDRYEDLYIRLPDPATLNGSK